MVASALGNRSAKTFVLVVLALWLAFGAPLEIGAACAQQNAQRVLLLHAFGHAYSPWSDMASSFRSELIKKSPGPIDLYEVSLDTARVQQLHGEGPFVDYIEAVLAGRKLDLLVPVGAPAAFFVQRNRQRLGSATRVLFFGADHRRIPESSLTVDDVAVLHENDMPAHLENILRVLPETKNVAVVVGSSSVERYWASELKRDFQPFTHRVNITWFDELTFGEMLTKAATMPPNSAIFFLLLIEDAAGVPYTQNRALEKFREVASAPIFGLGDFELGRGVVGGPVLQTQAIGERAAQVAIQILAGEPPGRPGVAPIQYGLPSYDWRELRRWNISEALLPPGSIVLFREPSVWARYRWPITAVAAIIPLQSMLVGYVIIQGRRRRRAEAEATQQRQEVAHLMRVSALGELSGSIAHEIHQPLTAIVSNAYAALHLLAKKSPDLEEIRDALQDIVHEGNRAGEVINRLRNLLKKGEPKQESVNMNDLVKSTAALLHSESINREISIGLDLEIRLLPVTGDSVQLQQVLLNLVMNAMDAMASTPKSLRQVLISTRRTEDGAIEVMVKDRGHGIAPTDSVRVLEPFYTTKETGLGLGLSICSTIIEAHGGKLTLVNDDGGGAIARFSLPAQKATAGVTQY